MSKVRFHVAPGDVPPLVAARRLGMTLEAFTAALPGLIDRGFPRPDQTTGNYDLDAIDAWRRARHPHLFPGTESTDAKDASKVVRSRLRMMGAEGPG
jgi:hypothetical protein